MSRGEEMNADVNLANWKEEPHAEIRIENDKQSYQTKKVQLSNDQEKAQSERESLSKKVKKKKTKLTIRHLYHEITS